MQRVTSTSQNPGPAEEGVIYSSPCTDLNYNTRKTVSSLPGFKKKKNQNPTLHFRPVNRTASAGEVFLCALRPPSWRKHQMSAPSRSSSLEAANREGSGRFPLSGPGYCPAAQKTAGEARLSGTAPPSSSRESPAPPERQKAQGKARRLRSKTGGPATSTNGSQTRIAAAATPTRLLLRDGE